MKTDSDEDRNLYVRDEDEEIAVGRTHSAEISSLETQEKVNGLWNLHLQSYSITQNGDLLLKNGGITIFCLHPFM